MGLYKLTNLRTEREKLICLLFIRFIKDPKLVNEFLFGKELGGITTGENMFESVNENILLSNL